MAAAWCVPRCWPFGKQICSQYTGWPESWTIPCWWLLWGVVVLGGRFGIFNPNFEIASLQFQKWPLLFVQVHRWFISNVLERLSLDSTLGTSTVETTWMAHVGGQIFLSSFPATARAISCGSMLWFYALQIPWHRHGVPGFLLVASLLQNFTRCFTIGKLAGMLDQNFSCLQRRENFWQISGPKLKEIGKIFQLPPQDWKATKRNHLPLRPSVESYRHWKFNKWWNMFRLRHIFCPCHATDLVPIINVKQN